LRQRLVGAPRFLFDAAATRTAVELTLGRPKVLLEAIEHVRIPYPKLWVEWEEAGRARLRDEFDPNPRLTNTDRPLPERVGFFLECDAETGRKGTVTWAWSGRGGGRPEEAIIPNIAPISPTFDLDRRFPQAADRLEAFQGNNLCRLWADHPVQVDALKEIWRTAYHAPSEWGLHYLAHPRWEYAGRPLPEVLAHCYADVYGEYIMVWATLMLLTASRPIVDYRRVDLARFNKARRKRGRPPRLDHTLVTLHLQDRAKQPVIRGALGFTRKSPRVHMVSSYLGRRGDKHWIVVPYWRGEGETIARRTQVKG
jgi:hypothetical protein